MPTRVATLPSLSVRVARSDDDRARVFALRSRMRPDAPPAGDAHDRLPNATLLLAESAHDGEALGTLRILAGDRGPLTIDGLLALPASMAHRSIAEGSQLIVRDGCDASLVRRMLWKAFHRYCLAVQLQTMLVAVRATAAHEYEALGFTDVFPGGPLVAPRGHDHATHRLMRLDVFEAHAAMLRNGHPLCEFFFVERHPEIDLLGSLAGSTRRPPRRVPERMRIAAELAEVAVV